MPPASRTHVDPRLAAGTVDWALRPDPGGSGTPHHDRQADGGGSASVGKVTVNSFKNSGGVLHWQIITGHVTLTGESDDVWGADQQNIGNLNLSHICVGPDATEEPTREPTSEPTTEPHHGAHV